MTLARARTSCRNRGQGACHHHWLPWPPAKNTIVHKYLLVRCDDTWYSCTEIIPMAIPSMLIQIPYHFSHFSHFSHFYHKYKSVFKLNWSTVPNHRPQTLRDNFPSLPVSGPHDYARRHTEIKTCLIKSLNLIHLDFLFARCGAYSSLVK